MKTHVVVLGAGFGGLELATRLSETAADAVRVTLIDRNPSWYFGYSKLDVMLGRLAADDVLLHYADVVKEGVTFSQETVTAIDPATRRVQTDKGTHDADVLVIAMGADYDFDATPGLREGGHEYYTLGGAERLRDALEDFDGGRVLVSVLGHPFKCPPAPFEGAFMLHEHFRERGMEDRVEVASVFPMKGPVPVTGEVSQMFRDGLAARSIEVHAETVVTRLDPSTRTAHLAGGGTLDYDLFVGIPKHRAPDPLPASGLAPNGWVKIDQANLRTAFDGVYAIGDVNTGERTVPKAGIFAESAAITVADDIVARVTGGEPPERWGASGTCYAEFGGGLVGKVEVNFLHGEAPDARRHDPALEWGAEKEQFGAVRRARWFGR